MTRTIVIGGGASGLVAAIAAAEEGQQVCILEATDRVGAKILATGNGRCNLTNMHAEAANYNAPSFVEHALGAWSPKEVRAWFKDRGLLTVEEREGRVYPLSNTATSVLDVLRNAAERAGVATACGKQVVRVSAAQEGCQGLQVELADGELLNADRVVAACGGGSELLLSAGHTLIPAAPVLGALATEVDPLRGLAGLRARAGVSLLPPEGEGDEPVFSEVGEVLFRDYGVSGIVIFNASRFATPGQRLVIDFMPSMGLHALEAMYVDRTAWARSYREVLTGIFHSQIAAAIMRAARCKPSAEPDSEGLHALAAATKYLMVAVKGPGDKRHAQVTRGGAALEEFDPATMESRLLSGLFACGEALDVDGPCGGYNLQWAWASGLVAGSAQ